MKIIKQEIFINAKPQEVYEAYVDAKKHTQFIGANVVFENRVGGKFDIWNGELTGENVELVKGKKIVQKWQAEDWPKGHYSQLTIELFTDNPSSVILGTSPSTSLRVNSVRTPESDSGPFEKTQGSPRRFTLKGKQARMTKGKDGTRLVLTQTEVPDDKADDIDSGWHQYYWKPMREYFNPTSL